MKLIQNWRQSWRWFSMQSMFIAGSIQTTWLALPPDLKDVIPVNWVLAVAAALMVFGMIGRLIPQSGETQDGAQ